MTLFTFACSIKGHEDTCVNVGDSPAVADTSSNVQFSLLYTTSYIRTNGLSGNTLYYL